MAALPTGQRTGSVVQAFWQWCRDRINRTAYLEDCGAEEVGHIAKDIGVSTSELFLLARSDPGAADLLPRRMAALDIDRNEVARIVPLTMQDLQRVCTLCNKHRRCARELARNATDPTWKDYCPNVGTLLALDAMPWTARAEW